ncbi:Quinolinate synthetase B [Thermococcus kodakarensis KOD1]|uniref:L-aspartate oxidase n=1 Tax=Thermococcus kodakarensis (strain ATCC BAA-918 / JCM 12380 / KOD1) TaxID=69014 RepID=Q5JFX8_THEKO|nr:L-aspartate oxidase [Thermococcus kodakarensis]WCN29161.1 L-aspartate oxidase [Thermococcus kodakarensis]WCN31466.1 L-aspartate oxidase [Thermococcus kodakarensis]BAD84486.1 Quinolinate synthetase B [Thermococcus kodakarensis KOD1]
MTSVGIIGGGIAGLTAALSLAKLGYEVTLIHTGINTTNSYLAQAGIAFPLLEGDSITAHVIDTMRGGKYINDKETVWNVISKASEAYDFLLSLGVKFETNETEGGHSFPRVFTIKNETGKHLTKILYLHAKEGGVNFIKGEAEELAVKHGKAYGVFVNGEFLKFDATIIASGGFTGLFKYTAGSPTNLGTLIGDAVMKGAFARDLEFIQFHPTGFIGEDGVKLISEAVRGAGARLVTEDGKRFVNELSTRDIVARAIYLKMQEGERVFLDATGIADFKKKFPQIYAFLRKEGIDPSRDLIPIAPIAHYTIGGIAVDTWYRTGIKNLYAIGEAASNGFHGANRLASNSLLECIVSGLEVARTIVRDKPKGREVKEPPYHGYETGDIESLREILWGHAGIVRNERTLKEGLKKLRDVEADPRLKLLVRGVLECALAREESRGAHYREDFPAMRKEFERPSFFDGKCRL